MEQDKHLARVEAFLARESADIVCLMEVVERDVPYLLGDYPERVFVSNFVNPAGIKTGVVLAGKQKIVEPRYVFTDGMGEIALPISGPEPHRPVVVSGRVGEFDVSAAHLTWTPDGGITIKQSEDIERLLKVRGELGGVICGDFNLPRNLPGGNELYDKIAQHWRDNIPLEIVSSIDPTLHRANKSELGKLSLMVDYVWSTPSYRVENVRLESGVSDHLAVVATVDKVEKMV